MRKPLSVAEGVLGSPVRNLVTVVIFMALVMLASTIAYMAAGWSLLDATYMVTLTVYTVGFDEVRPIDTLYLHVVTMGTIVLGCTGMILLTSALVQLFTELQLRQILGGDRMQHRIDKLSGHVVVCGFGRIGVMLARELADAGMPLVVVERSPERLAEAEADGHLTLAGDATDDAVLTNAGIGRARVLATVLPNDAANVFITLSARNLNPAIEIIARGEAPSTESKLRHAGATQVVLPTHIGAERIARMILFPESSSLNDAGRLQTMSHAVADLGLTLEIVTATPDSTGTGLNVAEAEARGGGVFHIAQIENRDGPIPRPPSDMHIAAGDHLLIVARDGGATARRLFTGRGLARD